ncbi:hypothetical protein GQX74_004771 [Glossina fuscipes]|nr:hypothetical protein GQX74_004771 [Glossina fuscipes]
MHRQGALHNQVLVIRSGVSGQTSFSNNGSRFLFSISCFMERFKEIFHIMTINDVNIATESFQTLTLKVTALHDYGRYKKNQISYSEYLKFSLNSYKLHDISIPIIVQSLLNLAFWSNSHNIKLCNINFVVK